MKGRALLIAAGFAAGIVVGVLVGAAGLDTAPDGSAAGGAAVLEPDDESAAPTRAGERRRTTSVEDEDPVAAAVAAVALDLPTEGKGRVSGTVRTADGTPVPGVRVRAWANEPDDLDLNYEDEDADLETNTRRFLRVQAWRRAAMRSATTGRDGKYALEGLLDDTAYWVGARAEGYEIDTAPGSRDEARDGSVVDFVAERRIAVDFRVALPDGSSPESCRVVFETNTEERSYASWPHQKRVHLQPAVYRVRATAGERRRWLAEVRGYAVEANVPPAPLVLRLRARNGLAGRLVFDESVKPKSVRVRLTSLPAGAEPSPALFQGRYEFETASRDEAYGFQFLDLASGEYVVAVEGLGSVGLDGMWPVTVGDRLEEHVFEVPPPDPDRYVEVRVFDPDGRPLRPASVELTLRKAHWVGARQNAVLPRPDGALWLARMDDQQRRYPEARYFVNVYDKRFGAIEVGLERPGDGAEIHFRRAALTEVTVRGLSAAGQQGELGVYLRKAGTTRLSGRGAAPGPDGLATLPPVQPGEYVVFLGVAHNYLPARPVAARPLLLEPGENRVTLTAPELHALVVEVGEAGRPWTLRATSAGGLAERLGSFFVDARPDVTGRVEFVRLPAGEFDVRAWGKGAPQEPRRVTVPSEAAVRW